MLARGLKKFIVPGLCADERRLITAIISVLPT